MNSQWLLMRSHQYRQLVKSMSSTIWSICDITSVLWFCVALMYVAVYTTGLCSWIHFITNYKVRKIKGNIFRMINALQYCKPGNKHGHFIVGISDYMTDQMQIWNLFLMKKNWNLFERDIMLIYDRVNDWNRNEKLVNWEKNLPIWEGFKIPEV